MALRPGDRANFDTLLRAAAEHNLCLVETTDAKTGEYVALICAMNIAVVDGKIVEYQPTPLAEMVKGNPYELYTDPMVAMEKAGLPQPDGNKENA